MKKVETPCSLFTASGIYLYREACEEKNEADCGNRLSEGCADTIGHQFSFGVHRGTLSICQAGGLYISHACISCDIGILKRQAETAQRLYSFFGVVSCSLYSYGERLYDDGRSSTDSRPY